jgi:hypothetical protein
MKVRGLGAVGVARGPARSGCQYNGAGQWRRGTLSRSTWALRSIGTTAKTETKWATTGAFIVQRSPVFLGFWTSYLENRCCMRGGLLTMVDGSACYVCITFTSPSSTASTPAPIPVYALLSVACHRGPTLHRSHASIYAVSRLGRLNMAKLRRISGSCSGFDMTYLNHTFLSGGSLFRNSLIS